MRYKLLLSSLVVLLFCGTTCAQLPFEVFAGKERTTLDLMFFRYFKNQKGGSSHWLFFNRNRASIDYRMTSSAYLPQFGFTEAVSFNHAAMRGFAPVLVGQVLSRGVYAKGGVQFVRLKPEFTLFSWLVTEMAAQPDIDLFLLLRYTPVLQGDLALFSQLELLETISSPSQPVYYFTQRIRLGLQHKSLQGGLGVDFNQYGSTHFTLNYNPGVFIRYQFGS